MNGISAKGNTRWFTPPSRAFANLPLSLKKKTNPKEKPALRAGSSFWVFSFCRLHRSGARPVLGYTGFGNLFRRNARSSFAQCFCASSQACSSVLEPIAQNRHFAKSFPALFVPRLRKVGRCAEFAPQMYRPDLHPVKGK